MLQPGGEADLPEEPVLRQRSSRARCEDLHGDRPLVPAVHRAIHHGRRAVPDLVTEHDTPRGELLSKAHAAWGVPRSCAWNAPGVRPRDCLKRRLRWDWSAKPHS